MSLGWTEIALIVVIILLLFGAKRIPELARSLGRASYEFKKAKNAMEDEIKVAENAAAKEEEKNTTPATTDETSHKEG